MRRPYGGVSAVPSGSASPAVHMSPKLFMNNSTTHCVLTTISLTTISYLPLLRIIKILEAVQSAAWQNMAAKHRSGFVGKQNSSSNQRVRIEYFNHLSRRHVCAEKEKDPYPELPWAFHVGYGIVGYGVSYTFFEMHGIC
eukprot:737056-Pleurochrysis_carterae.AAC.5